MKKVIGITGSIGSGKSYAVEMFKKICIKNKIKASFIDIDEIRRNILQKEGIDRNSLNKKIYNDVNAMAEYKKFINLKIRQCLINQINNTNNIIFIEWALLIEDGLYDIVDNIIMVYCKENIQIERLKDGDLGKDAIINRMKFQLSNEEKINKLKLLNKEFYILDASNNPKLKEYEDVLRREELYE